MRKTILINLGLFLLVLIGSNSRHHSLLAQNWDLTPENISRALNEASGNVSSDPLRPAFHLTPPAGCMGDPNGGIYHNGWFLMPGVAIF
jgi:hypothetical protein